MRAFSKDNKLLDHHLFRVPLLLLLAVCWIVTGANAEIYRWKDENGIWHFTEGPSSTPQKPQPSAPRTTPAPAPEPRPESAGLQPAPLTNGGLLWKISGNAGRPSYIMGTIHSSDPRVTRLKPAVASALDGCDRFVMEMELDTSAIMAFGATMMMSQGEDLEAILGPRLFKRTVAAMAGIGLPEMVVRQLKPWVAMAMLSMPPSTGGMILDMVLRQRATSQGKPTSGLETAQEQLAVFESLSQQDQVELLELTLDHLPSQPAMFEQLIEAYASDNLDHIARIAHKNNTRVPSQAARRFMTRLNDERNDRMVQRIVPYLEQANSFIAVGALHLPGNRGILTQLRQRGYTITPVP